MIMKTHKDFSFLPQPIYEKLTAMGITEPTPVQAQSIDPILAGKDLLATAQTGTGKTLAFVLPLVLRMQEDPKAEALILSPTRELAQQTYQTLTNLWQEEGKLPAALVIGGDNIHKQFASLRKKPRFIIATPGRVIDHMQRKTISLTKVKYVVLDETDRMLDMGFIAPLRQIMKAVPNERQTLMFSATMPKEVIGFTKEFLTDPVTVKIGSVSKPVDLIAQELVQLSTRDKLPQLLEELDTRKGSILIFVKTKHGADRLAKQLKQYGHKVNALHGDLRQNRRRQVLEFFREGSIPVLIATDVAARGIDVPHIGHVINFDLPMCPEDYIHRIGRTGRAGVVGSAISFVADDGQKWKSICRSAELSGKVRSKTKTSKPLPEPKFVVEDLRASSKSAGVSKKGGRSGGKSTAEFSKPASRKTSRMSVSSAKRDMAKVSKLAEKNRSVRAADKQSYSMRGATGVAPSKTGRPINTSPRARREAISRQFAYQDELTEDRFEQRRGGGSSSRFAGSRGATPLNKRGAGAPRSENSGRRSSFKKADDYGRKSSGAKKSADVRAGRGTFNDYSSAERKTGGKRFGGAGKDFKTNQSSGGRKFGGNSSTEAKSSRSGGGYKKQSGFGKKKFGDRKSGPSKFTGSGASRAAAGPKIVRVGASKKKLEKQLRVETAKEKVNKPSIFSRFFKRNKRK